MGWAAKRSTTRVEDEAYCLFGIFGINMPTLYGEGRNAFYRLQGEILRTSPDISLLAWGFALSPQACIHDMEDMESVATRLRWTPNPFALQHEVFEVEDHKWPYLFAPSPSAFARNYQRILFTDNINTKLKSGFLGVRQIAVP